MWNFIAQATTDAFQWWAQPLAVSSVLGPVLIWFMLRAEKKLDENAKHKVLVAQALERLTQGLMVTNLALRHLDGGLRDIAQRIHNEAELAQKQHNEIVDR